MAHIITLPKGSLVSLAGTQLTEHNRSTLNVSYDEIRQDKRVIVGTMKRYTIASKRKFSLSWSNLPMIAAETVDGKTGFNELKTLTDTNKPNMIQFKIKNYSTTDPARDAYNQVDESINVFIDAFSWELIKRYGKWYYNCNLSLVEQ